MDNENRPEGVASTTGYRKCAISKIDEDFKKDNEAIADLIPTQRNRFYQDFLLYRDAKARNQFMEPTTPASFSELVQAMEILALEQHPYQFRGAANSSWKLWTSSQRHWYELCSRCGKKELVRCQAKYAAYLSRLLNLVKSPELGAIPNLDCVCDHQVFGYLQHYGCPTPFLDFSKSFWVALHMAVRSVRPGQLEPMSIYAIREGARTMSPENDLYDLDWFLSGKSAYSLNPDSECAYADKAMFKNWDSPDKIDNQKVFMVWENVRPWQAKLKQGRLERQTGLFLCNLEPDTPTEELLSYSARGNSRLKCFEVPCKWIPEIEAELANRRVSDETLGLTDCETQRKVRDVVTLFDKDIGFSSLI